MTQHLIVTGGICSGKSSILRYLAEYYPQPQFSFDEYTKELYQLPNVQTFLMSFFGTINKSEISNIVFQSPAQLALLDEFFMPMVVEKFVEVIQSDTQTIIEFPLYFQMCIKSDTIRNTLCDRYSVLKVYCDPQATLKRIVERDKISYEKAAKIVASQRYVMQKVTRADYLIDTSSGAKEMDAVNIHSYISYVMKEVFNEPQDSN